MTSRKWMRGVWALLPVMVLATPAMGQIPQASVVGRVEDPTTARVAGAGVSLRRPGSAFERHTTTNRAGEFRIDGVPPGSYRRLVTAAGFSPAETELHVAVGSLPTVSVELRPQRLEESVEVRDRGPSLATQPLDTTSSVERTVIAADDLSEFPLAARSFANISYLAPMTEPVEPSDPTKARITAVSFAGSSGTRAVLLCPVPPRIFRFSARTIVRVTTAWLSRFSTASRAVSS